MQLIDITNPTVQLLIGLFVALVLTTLSTLRLYCFITLGRCHSKQKMNGKTVLITGANGGIGKETARDIAKRGARIIMACRNLQTANQVRDEIIKETGNTNIVVKKLDLGSQRSIREFAADILKTESKLDVLIHNAGMALFFNGQQSEDGIELTMATNHYGPFLLTHLLIDLLKKSAPSRIVVVASGLYKFASVNLDNLNPLTTKPALYLYYVSKFANIYFARELAERLEGTGVTANSLHPGLIDTGIWQGVPFPLVYPMRLLTRSFFKTPEQGAQTTIHLAVSDELNGVSGRYYADCQEQALSASAMDMDRAKKLWEESVKMVKLTDNDPKI